MSAEAKLAELTEELNGLMAQLQQLKGPPSPEVAARLKEVLSSVKETLPAAQEEAIGRIHAAKARLDQHVEAAKAREAEAAKPAAIKPEPPPPPPPFGDGSQFLTDERIQPAIAALTHGIKPRRKPRSQGDDKDIWEDL